MCTLSCTVDLPSRLPPCSGRGLLRGFPSQREDVLAQYVVGTRMYWNAFN